MDVEISNGEEGQSLSSQRSRSTYGLLDNQSWASPPTATTRMIQGSKKSKIFAGIIFTAALISCGAGYIALHHANSTQEIMVPLEESSSSTGVESKSNVFLLQSRPEDTKSIEPIALPLAQSQNQNTGSVPQRRVGQNVQPTESPISSLADTRPTTTKAPKKPKHKDLPPDAASRSPVSLLYEMLLNPQFTFYECKDFNIPLGFKAKLFIFVNGTDQEPFFGYGPNKRTAKRIAAEKACNAVYNFNYPFEDIPGLANIVEHCRNATVHSAG